MSERTDMLEWENEPIEVKPKAVMSVQLLRCGLPFNLLEKGLNFAIGLESAFTGEATANSTRGTALTEEDLNDEGYRAKRNFGYDSRTGTKIRADATDAIDGTSTGKG